MKKSKAIVLTGASSKIGSKLALELAKAGHQLILHYHSNQEKIDVLSEELKKLGTAAKFFRADFTQSDQLRKFIEFSNHAFSEIDCLINNAAYWPNEDKIKGSFDLLSETESNWDKTQRINVRAPFFLIQGLANKLLVSEKGLVINLLDSCIDQPFLGRASYSISKSALTAITSLASQAFSGKIRIHGLILPFVSPSESLENNTKPWIGVQRLTEKILFLLENSSSSILIRI